MEQEKGGDRKKRQCGENNPEEKVTETGSGHEL